jgi:hypothetical protein
VAFLALYKELVETNTTLVGGSCTLAAERMAAHLKAAGYADRTSRCSLCRNIPRKAAWSPFCREPRKPRSRCCCSAISMWSRPSARIGRAILFTLIEENGYFYARGTSDMKAMDATWVDALSRFKQSGYQPKRTIKLALTCGEETTYAFNGAEWLAKNRPELISAAFA